MKKSLNLIRIITQAFRFLNRVELFERSKQFRMLKYIKIVSYFPVQLHLRLKQFCRQLAIIEPNMAINTGIDSSTMCL